MFRAIFVITLLLNNIHSPLHAEDAKPNTLTPKEIAEGWILLFDGETTLGWKTEGAVRTHDGLLVLGGDKETSIQTTCKFGSDFEIYFDYSNNKLNLEDAVVRAGVTWGDSFKHQTSLSHTTGEWALGTITHRYDTKKKTYSSVITSCAKKSSTQGAAEGITPEERPNRGIGFVVPSGAMLLLRSIKLKPLGLESVFNSKDLTGWKKFETDPAKAKSEFTVTKDGCIHLKNGPGDLQTEGQYKDFILQAECFCNGDRLNSGIFFRCLPDQYQQGYEAQIHNGFTEKPEKEYTIEEYDPETHKLTGTKKVKYAALDYGTGGIYRRIPARRSVAKDKEWFTMTVVAHGRHIATWVNGIQVVDWTDNRPENDNARNGCKLGKGAISLQGHDATTDLSFRNIRIAELPLSDKK